MLKKAIRLTDFATRLSVLASCPCMVLENKSACGDYVEFLFIFAYYGCFHLDKKINRRM